MTAPKVKVSISSLGVLRACPMMYHWNYDWGYRSPGNTTMAYGTAVHAGLEQLWKGAGLAAARAATQASALAELAKLRIDDDGTRGAEFVEGTVACVAAYATHWGDPPFSKAFKPAGAEIEFEVELPWCDAVLTGRIDAEVETPRGVWPVEHKTVGTLEPSYFNKLRMDLQTTGYFYAYEVLRNRAPPGMIYDVVRRGSPQPPAVLKNGQLSIAKSAPTSYELFKAAVDLLDKSERSLYDSHLKWLKSYGPRWFQRELIVRDQSYFEDFKAETTGLVQLIRSGNRWRNTANCHRYGAPCAYFDICAPGAHEPKLASRMFDVRSSDSRVTHGKS